MSSLFGGRDCGHIFRFFSLKIRRRQGLQTSAQSMFLWFKSYTAIIYTTISAIDQIIATYSIRSLKDNFMNIYSFLSYDFLKILLNYNYRYRYHNGA